MVTASQSSRTKFQISFAANNNSKSNNIMINFDYVQITLVFDACSCDKSTGVAVQSDGALKIQKNATNFMFGDFANGGFEIKDITTAANDGGEPSNAIVQTNNGEAWELV